MNISNNIVWRYILFAGVLTTIGGLETKANDLPAVWINNKQDSVVFKGIVIDANNKQLIEGARLRVEDSEIHTGKNGSFIFKTTSPSLLISAAADGFHEKKQLFLADDTIVVQLLKEEQHSLFAHVDNILKKESRADISSSIGSPVLENRWLNQKESLESSLQGRVSGLQVTRRSGSPGIGGMLNIRGTNSLYGSRQPLIVVDGAIYDNFSYGNSLISGHQFNALQHIDLKDVQEIAVIKDALNSYGVKGGNGVIRITTRAAKELSTRIDYASYLSLDFAPSSFPLLNASEFRTYLADLYKAQGYSADYINSRPYLNNDPESSTYYTYANETDWQKQIFRNAIAQQHYLNVTGGDNIARYSLSLGYTDQEGVTKETGRKNYQTRFNAHLNLTRKLSAIIGISLGYTEQQLKDQGANGLSNPIFLALVKSPFTATHELNASGVFSPNLSDVDIFNVGNPLALIQKANESDKNYRFNGNFGFTYKINPKISLHTLGNLQYNKIRENIFIPNYGVADEETNLAVIQSRLGSRVNRYNALFNETKFSYNNQWRQQHFLDLQAGFRFQNVEIEDDYVKDFNGATDDLVTVGNGVPYLREVGGGIGHNNWLNTFVQLNYNFKGKYFVQSIFNGDGSSRFGKESTDGVRFNGNNYAILPAFGASWLISNEKFLAQSDGIDLLKIRASLGWNGLDDIGNYNAKNYYVSQNFLGFQGLVRGNIGNPSLQWETVRKFNLGLDASLFSERFQLAFDWYSHQSSNGIYYKQLENSNGLDNMLVNGVSIKNHGVELDLHGRIINRTWKWDAGLTIAHNESRIHKLPEEIVHSYSGAELIVQNGAAPNLFYGYKTNGIISSQAHAEELSLRARQENGLYSSFQAGDVWFNDRDGNGVIDEADKVVIGNPNPDYFGGLSNNFFYKNWSFQTFLTFSVGNDIYNYTRSILESGSREYNQTTLQYNRWQQEDQEAELPRLGSDITLANDRFSDRWIEDGSYLRLKNISITYKWNLKHQIIRYVHLTLSASNLFTWTKYNGFDPEFNNSGQLWTQGTDTPTEPITKSIQFGLRVGL
ncbi:SusC/RagA family TonB-linked outer membrane protein [Sphingobacterium sp. LRF_L2]|uniref:SusC/RagA family TonB-linked outer membrane protein n=1 Tax=Sphingobacterium sp. LRF_L2 TaxID=3369421 RepID=UPI003F6341FA